MKTTSGSFGALCAIGIFARFSYALARTPVLPLFALYLGAGPEVIGWAVGISTVTGILFKLPSGALSDWFGRGRTLFLGLLIFALTPFAYLLVWDTSALLVVRFIHGFATAIYGPVSMAIVAEVAGYRKGEFLSWFSSLTIVGTLLGAPIGGYLLRADGPGQHLARGGFLAVFLLRGLSGVMALLLGLKFARLGARTATARPFREIYARLFAGIKEVLSDKRIAITSWMEGVHLLAVGALEAFLPIYAIQVAGLGAFQVGLLWGVQVVTTILSKPLMGRTSDRYGRRPVIAGGLVLSALAFGTIPLLHDFTWLLVAAAFFGLGEAFVTSSANALVADLCQEQHFGTAMGAFGTIFDVGHAAGPILAGYL
ncbi:MAG: MFS transporter, partial [Deltaproteobacteria bacterium]|nr:MFS transporter [Deltaproteobacteria bacterium]